MYTKDFLRDLYKAFSIASYFFSLTYCSVAPISFRMFQIKHMTYVVVYDINIHIIHHVLVFGDNKNGKKSDKY